MLDTALVPPELVVAMGRLPGSRRAAVLAARAAWIDGGLAEPAANRHAVAYAGRLRGRQLERVTTQAHQLQRVAKRYEAELARVFLTACESAGRVFPGAGRLALLGLGEADWQALEPVVRRLEAGLA